MEITGKVLVLELNATIRGQKGSYKGAELIYKDPNGETKTKPFHENALKYNAALKNGLDNLKVGDDFTATLEKKDEFWNWINIVKGVGAVNNNDSKPGVSTPYVNKSAPSTYATAEERTQTQKYIVRQSSITAALKLTEVRGDKKTNVGEVLQLAAQFETWVYGNNQAKTPDPAADIADMTDDIPY
jgi:hypothetical protein